MIDRLRVSAFVAPTDFPEADGTLGWNETTILVVRIDGDGQQGLGYSYADQAKLWGIRESGLGATAHVKELPHTGPGWSRPVSPPSGTSCLIGMADEKKMLCRRRRLPRHHQRL